MTTSIGLAVLGIIASALAIVFSGHRLAAPARCWFLGMGALAPAWLVSLLVFLTGLADAGKGLRVYLAGASAAALLGVIGSEYGVRRLEARSGTQAPFIFWLLGVAALVPSWLVLLSGIMAR